jgi:2-polyprenyl-3-methyl-5-hydroxy-6-metoxy-1,4-benzoquinol methylase
MAVDQAKLDAFMGGFVHDLGAVMHAATVVVGDELGLYKALAEKPLLAEELAQATETDARYVREWLSAQAASGYVNYDPASGRFSLSEEQSFALAQEGSPAFIPGAFQIAVAQFKIIPKMVKSFKTGLGVGWHEHDVSLFHGTERFFRPGYAAYLVSDWIPSLDGIEAKLKDGARVADIGCGHGASTIIMAQAYPQSNFVGYDYHEPSIAYARESAAKAGVSDRVSFDVASASDYPGRDYDFVTMFDCLHDMGDPLGASRHVFETLGSDGAWMIVEPFANDTLEGNLNPVGRIFYSASTLICTPASRAQAGAMCLGAQAGEQRIRDVVTQGGFQQFRRATATPFNLVFEARR